MRGYLFGLVANVRAYIVRRILLLIPVLFGVSVLTFTLVHITPGDAAQILAGQEVTDALMARLRAEMHLDRPLLEQYGLYIQGLLRGDLGKSYRTLRPVVEEIRFAFPATVILTATAMFISIPLGLLVGIISAVKQNSVVDHLSRFTLLTSVSMPVFLSGLLLIYFLSVRFRLLPSTGRGGIEHLILPALSLSTYSTALLARTMRSAMLDVIREDCITVARAKGLSNWSVVMKHALKNALIPVVTMIGVNAGILLGGAVLAEKVFAWPGMGRLLIESISTRDVPVIQACVIISASIFVVVNVLVDLFVAWLDPRIRYV